MNSLPGRQRRTLGSSADDLGAAAASPAPDVSPGSCSPFWVLAVLLVCSVGLFAPLLKERFLSAGGALVDGPGPSIGRPDDTWSGWGAAPHHSTDVHAHDARFATVTLLTEPVKEAAPAPEEHTFATHQGRSLPLLADGYAARRVNPDVFDLLPPHGFNAGTKSPCWMPKSGPLRCLPAFFVLGVFQCGHGDFVQRLAIHPDVAGVEAPFFWDERPSHPFSGYLDRFSRIVPLIQAKPETAVAGDISFATFTYTWTGSQRVNGEWAAEMHQCRQECAKLGRDTDRQTCIDETCYARAGAAYKGPKISVPRLLKNVYSDYPLKLIVLLRDPVERLHTAYFNYHHYQAKYGRTEQGFSTYAQEMVDHVKDCLRHHTEIDCVTAFEALSPAFEATFYHADQVLKSLYAPFMEGWMKAFPGGVLPIRLEDFSSGDQAALADVLKRAVQHLGLSPLEEPVLASMLAVPVKTQGEAHLRVNGRTMEPATRFMLREFYAPYNLRLAHLLGDEKWRWGY